MNQELWPPIDRRELVRAWVAVGPIWPGAYGIFGIMPRDFTTVCSLQQIGDRFVAVPRFGFPRAPRNG